ncbi:MAG TPA: hypothetical protein VNT75_22710 [Symbiobacteriaceae bacterium]|nr:hypothetical protein [Symbiobacteriaceae bacterium]
MKLTKLMKYGLLAVAAAWILTGCTVQVSTSGLDTCKFREERSATLPAADVRTLNVLARSGSLRIEGRSGLTEVRVRGTACATTQDLVSRVDLKAEKAGDTIRVEAVIPPVSVGNSPMLDLALEVPESMIARIEDTSGDIEVRRIAEVEIDDESGSMDVVDIAGPVRITDESGEIEVINAGGDVRIPRDQSGNITIRAAARNVTIDRDESGEITISDVAGDVLIDTDESGGIDVRDIRGNFTVNRDGSGGIRYEHVSGSVRVPSK